MNPETPLDALRPHKYGYNTGEQVLMVIITAITNFSGLPCSIYLYRIGRYFEAFNAAFTVITSFMYHAVESINSDDYFLEEGQWHRLDNIGSISCFMFVMIHFMDNKNPQIDLQLYLASLFIAIFAQEKDPWNLYYTLVPIAISIIAFLGVLAFRKRKPELNTRHLGKGLFGIFIAALCFAKGLNEYEDYLRISHGCWHMFVGFASFHFWQVKFPPGQSFSWNNFWKKDFNYRLIEMGHLARDETKTSS